MDRKLGRPQIQSGGWGGIDWIYPIQDSNQWLQFSNMPAVATEMFFIILLQFFTTTCFGPYRPSSGGT
jgi:hypothetical protein